MKVPLPFDISAEYYDAIYCERDIKNDLFRVIDLIPVSARILDIGCGTGFHSIHLQELGYRVVGLDPSLPMIKVARGKGLKNVVQGLAQDFRFSHQQNSFDCVLCLFDVLDYVVCESAFQKALKNIRDVLTVGGYLFIESWNKDSMPEKYDSHSVKEFLYQSKKAVRKGTVTHCNGLFSVKYVYSIEGLNYYEEHVLHPRFGFDNSFVTNYGFDIKKQEQDNYSVKIILRAC